ncbi:MAG TPA: dihydroorotase [Candidatus Cloacimonetes bacterium]|nr:dihydroorotase [Candidatus Cloacimonadota bacterium]HEX38384.1 dihydroorotase [Candidatus Cloacimonadota bacterium]
MQILKNVIVPLQNDVWLCDVKFNTQIHEIVKKEKVPSQSKKLIEYISHNRIHDLHKEQYLILLPAAIDPHVHYDDPGFTWREDFYSGTLAAAFGGITTIIDMPCTSIPPVINGESFSHKLDEVKNKAVVDYAFWGGVSGTEFDTGDVRRNMKVLKNKGVVGFKIYLISGMDEFIALTKGQLEKVGYIARELNMLIAVHAEDKVFIEKKSRQFIENDRNTFKDYCAARSTEAEYRAIKTVIDVAKKTNAQFHIVHLSSKRGLELIREAQKKGLHITTETCPHFLAFTQDDYDHLGNILKTAPPVKYNEDREALWGGLIDGTISFVTTDHAGCDYPREKSTGNIWKDYAGIPGSELMLPFMVSDAFMKGRVNLCELQKLVSTNAAKQYGFQYKKGSIAEGLDADLVLVDILSETRIEAEKLHSKGKYSPFDKVNFKGKINRVYLRGKPIIEDDVYVGRKGEGQFLYPSRA